MAQKQEFILDCFLQFFFYFSLDNSAQLNWKLRILWLSRNIVPVVILLEMRKNTQS